MLLPTEEYRKLVSCLLLNCYSMNNIGLLNGKAGMAVVLFEASRYLQDEAIEEHAFRVLQASLIEKSRDISVGNGKGGTGYVVAYLIRNGFLEADYNELFGKQHLEILAMVLRDDFKMKDVREYIRLLLFLSMPGSIVASRQQAAAVDKLFALVEKTVGSMATAKMEELNSDYFYRFFAGTLNLDSYYPDVIALKRVIMELKKIEQHLSAAGWICECALFARACCKYGTYKHDRPVVMLGKKQAEIILKNAIPGVANLQELVDTALLASEIKTAGDWLGNARDYLSGTQLEGKLVSSISHQAYYLGVMAGIGRLLIAEASLEQENTMISELLSFTL